MENKPREQRTPLIVRMKVEHPLIGEMEVKTRNISNSGVFLNLPEPSVLPMGARLTGQMVGMMHDAPIVEMEVVRADQEGVGLKFVELDGSFDD